MPAFSSRLRYGAVAQLFHWTTVVLVITAYLLGEGGPQSRVYAPERAFTLSAHETLGVLVLLLTVLRLAWRAMDRTPDNIPMPRLMLIASRAVHGLLYVLLLALPLTAIFGAWFQGHPVTLFGGVLPIGPLTAVDGAFGNSLADVHGTLGNAILWVAGLHAAAALLHHFVMRDRVLMTMLPGRSATDA
ncbi:MAG: cytochrome b/b6 domain-containing protein [Rhizobiales bacterium]|nr:cytochrome b/b6 domain-containing protein [Hyphomicrobiales bacterium]